MTGEIAWLAASIVAGGIVTGILAGLFGIGGGAVIVPILYEVFRLPTTDGIWATSASCCATPSDAHFV
jgi:uncharacterized membrane protein YfcA